MPVHTRNSHIIYCYLLSSGRPDTRTTILAVLWPETPEQERLDSVAVKSRAFAEARLQIKKILVPDIFHSALHDVVGEKMNDCGRYVEVDCEQPRER